MWIEAKKDTFAIGNITGAMVFQSCIPVTIGILLTPWHLNLGDTTQMLEAVCICIALLSGAVLYWRSSHKELHAVRPDVGRCAVPDLLHAGADERVSAGHFLIIRPYRFIYPSD